MNAMVGEVRTEGPTPAGGAYAIAYFSRDGVPVDQSAATHVEITEYAADGTPIQTDLPAEASTFLRLTYRKIM